MSNHESARADPHPLSVYQLVAGLYRVQSFTETSMVMLQPFASDGWQEIVRGDGSRVALTIQNASAAGNITYRVGQSLIGGTDSSGFTLGPGQSYTVTAIFDFDQPADLIVGYGSVANTPMVIQQAIITPTDLV